MTNMPFAQGNQQKNDIVGAALAINPVQRRLAPATQQNSNNISAVQNAPQVVAATPQILFTVSQLQYNSLAEAKIGKFRSNYVFDVTTDDSYPQGSPERVLAMKKRYAALLIRAMIDKTICIDKESTIANFDKKSDQHHDNFERYAWEILDLVLEMQSRPEDHPQGRPAHRTVTEHIHAIVLLLRKSTSLVRNVAIKPALPAMVEDAKVANKKLNDNKRNNEIKAKKLQALEATLRGEQAEHTLTIKTNMKGKKRVALARKTPAAPAQRAPASHVPAQQVRTVPAQATPAVTSSNQVPTNSRKRAHENDSLGDLSPNIHGPKRQQNVPPGTLTTAPEVLPPFDFQPDATLPALSVFLDSEDDESVPKDSMSLDRPGNSVPKTRRTSPQISEHESFDQELRNNADSTHDGDESFADGQDERQMGVSTPRSSSLQTPPMVPSVPSTPIYQNSMDTQGMKWLALSNPQFTASQESQAQLFNQWIGNAQTSTSGANEDFLYEQDDDSEYIMSLTTGLTPPQLPQGGFGFNQGFAHLPNESQEDLSFDTSYEQFLNAVKAANDAGNAGFLPGCWSHGQHRWW